MRWNDDVLRRSLAQTETFVRTEEEHLIFHKVSAELAAELILIEERSRLDGSGALVKVSVGSQRIVAIEFVGAAVESVDPGRSHHTHLRRAACRVSIGVAGDDGKLAYGVGRRAIG